MSHKRALVAGILLLTAFSLTLPSVSHAAGPCDSVPGLGVLDRAICNAVASAVGTAITTSLQKLATILIAVLVVVGVVAGMIVGVIYALLLNIVKLILDAVLTPFFTFILAQSIKSTVQGGWEATRNLANLFILFGLVIEGLRLILNQNMGQAQQNIVKIMMVALLINFSLLGLGVIYDVSSVFITSILPSDLSQFSLNPVQVKFEDLIGFTGVTLGNALGGIGDVIWASSSNLPATLNKAMTQIVGAISPLIILYLWVATSQLEILFKLYLLFLFAMRFAVAAFVIVFFPFAMAIELVPFAGPELTQQKDKFFKQFIEYMVNPVIFILIIILGITVVAAVINKGVPGCTGGGSCIPGISVPTQANQAAQLAIRLTLALVMYYMVIKVAKGFAPMVNQAEDWTKKLLGFATGLVVAGGAAVATGGATAALGLGGGALSKGIGTIGQKLSESNVPVVGRVLRPAGERMIRLKQTVDERSAGIRTVTDANGKERVVNPGEEFASQAVDLGLSGKAIAARPMNTRMRGELIKALAEKKEFDKILETFEGLNQRDAADLARHMKEEGHDAAQLLAPYTAGSQASVASAALAMPENYRKSFFKHAFGSGGDTLARKLNPAGGTAFTDGKQRLSDAIIGGNLKHNAGIINVAPSIRGKIIDRAATASGGADDKAKALDLVAKLGDQTSGFGHDNFMKLGYGASLDNLRDMANNVGQPGGAANFAEFQKQAKEAFGVE